MKYTFKYIAPANSLAASQSANGLDVRYEEVRADNAHVARAIAARRRLGRFTNHTFVTSASDAHQIARGNGSAVMQVD